MRWASTLPMSLGRAFMVSSMSAMLEVDTGMARSGLPKGYKCRPRGAPARRPHARHFLRAAAAAAALLAPPLCCFCVLLMLLLPALCSSLPCFSPLGVLRRYGFASSAATAPPATADSATRSQWLTRDAAARLAICNHLPLAECAHFGQHRTALALYNAVDARYSSPATAAQGSGSGGSGGGRTGTQRGGSGGGHRQHQQRRSETPSPQQHREWFAQRGASGGSRCFSCLDDAWLAEFGNEAERPRWTELLRSGVAIFDLDYDAILAAMYALSVTAEGDCYLCVPPDPGIEAVALGATESVLPGTAPGEALHTFTLDSGASRCFFRDICLQLRERFRTDLTVLRLHSVRGGEFSSDLLHDFCCGEGILQSFTQNGIFERHIGLVMEVARTSMIHAAAPHFLWPFTVRYAVHKLNLWPRVSLLETSPTLRWTGKVGDASVFRVWGSRAFLRDTSADKLSARAIPCVFLGFSPDAPGWQFYHPTSHRVFPSHDLNFYESFPFSRPPPVDPLRPQGPAPSGVSQVDPLLGTAPVEVAVGSGAAPGAAFGGAESGGAEPGGAEPWGAEPGGAESEGAGSGGAEPGGEESEGAGSMGTEPWGAEPGGAELAGVEPGGTMSGGAEPRGTASSGGPTGAPPCLFPQPEPLSPQQLREWFAQRTRLRSGATGDGDSAAKATGAGGAGVTTGAGGSVGAAVAGPGGARTRGTGAAGADGVGGAGAGDPTEPGAAGGGAGAVLGVPSSSGLAPPLLCPPPDQSQPPLQPASPLSAPCPYTEQTGGVTEHREPASRLASPVRTGRRVSRPRSPPVPGTHAMALRPSSVQLRVPLLPPPESSLLAVPDPESDRARAASPNVSHLLATVVTDPSFESTAASALVAELVDFAAACRLDYATSLVAETDSASPLSIGGECAFGTHVLEDRQEDFECLEAAVPHFASMLLAPEGDPDAPDSLTPRSYVEAITGPYSSQWQAAMDAEMAS
ncbi:unnamed protein product [Closterium sp. NIES-54]